MDKLYAIFGAALCIFFFYASRTGMMFFDFGPPAGHTKPTGPGLHHK